MMRGTCRGRSQRSDRDLRRFTQGKFPHYRDGVRHLTLGPPVPLDEQGRLQIAPLIGHATPALHAPEATANG